MIGRNCGLFLLVLFFSVSLQSKLYAQDEGNKQTQNNQKDENQPPPRIDRSNQDPMEKQQDKDGEKKQENQTPPAELNFQPNLTRTDRISARTSRLSRAPYMLGSPIEGSTIFANFASFGPIMTGFHQINVPIGSGRIRKIGENNSPMPRDRFVFSYHHFSNVYSNGFSPDGISTEFEEFNADRYAFGFEKTFGPDQLMSLELRMPLINSLGTGFHAESRFDPRTNTLFDGYNVGSSLGSNCTELGDMSLIFKALLWRIGDSFALSGGSGLIIPTGEDFEANIVSNNGVQRFMVENDTTIITPYFGTVWTPNDRFFMNMFTQFDIPTSNHHVESSITFPDDSTTIETGSIGTQTFYHLDTQMGYWLYRQPFGTLTGLAAFLEFHYMTTLESRKDDVALGQTGITVSSFDFFRNQDSNRTDILNLTMGTTMEFNGRTALSLGCAFPLKRESDRTFDFEFILQLNHRFGRVIDQ